MQIRLLGPLEVVQHGLIRPVPGTRRQTLLAVLALRCGEVVDAGRLIDLVWGDSAPPAGNTLQTHVSHLRRVLKIPIVARAAGYAVDLAHDGTDVLIAERLIRHAQHTTDPAGRVRKLRTALALWRGRPLAGIADLAWIAEQTRRLDQLQRQANQALIDARLSLGQHAELIVDIQQLIRENPYDEQLHGQLMLALYRCGRQVDALAVYDRLRHALAETLGIDPGQAVRDQHIRILRQDPSLETPTPPATTTSAETAATPASLTRAVPAQLPAAVPGYACEQARIHDSGAERRIGLHRLLDHYVHTAHTATRLLNPTRDPIELTPPHPGVTVEHLACHDDALAWFSAEQQVLLAAVERAAGASLDAHTWQLAWALSTFLLRRGLWTEQATLQGIALRAARRRGDRVGQGHTLRSLAKALVWLGRLDDAEPHYRQAEELFAALGDPVGRAHAYLGLVTVAVQRGDLGDALRLAEHAHTLYRDGGDQVGQANTLNAVGWFHTRLGDHRKALDYCQRALPILRQAGYRDAEAGTWDSLGHVYRSLADYPHAASCHQHAVDLYRDLSDRYGEADSLASLGDTHHAAADPDTAGKAWHQALDILIDLGHPDASKIRAKLRSVVGTDVPGRVGQAAVDDRGEIR